MSRVIESATWAPTRILRKRCCRTLPACSPAAFLQSIHKVGMGTLKRRVNAHEQPGEQRQPNGEEQHRSRESADLVVFKRQNIRGDFRNDRNQLPRHVAPIEPCDDADQNTLKNKKSQDAAARCTQCHAQRDLTFTAAETNKQKIRHIAARDQQDECDRAQAESGTPTRKLSVTSSGNVRRAVTNCASILSGYCDR